MAYKNNPATVINSKTSLGLGGIPFCPLLCKSNLPQKFLLYEGEK